MAVADCVPPLNVPPRPCRVPLTTLAARPGVPEGLRKLTLSKITPDEPPTTVLTSTALSVAAPLASTLAS